MLLNTDTAVKLLPVFMHHPAHPSGGSSYDPENPFKFSNGFGIGK